MPIPVSLTLNITLLETSCNLIVIFPFVLLYFIALSTKLNIKEYIEQEYFEKGIKKNIERGR